MGLSQQMLGKCLIQFNTSLLQKQRNKAFGKPLMKGNFLNIMKKMTSKIKKIPSGKILKFVLMKNGNEVRKQSTSVLFNSKQEILTSAKI